MSQTSPPPPDSNWLVSAINACEEPAVKQQLQAIQAEWQRQDRQHLKECETHAAYHRALAIRTVFSNPFAAALATDLAREFTRQATDLRARLRHSRPGPGGGGQAHRDARIALWDSPPG